MVSFDQMIASSASVFTGTFGESVVYTPAGGAARTILAVVDRSPQATITEAGVVTPQLRISVRNHATLGVLASAVNQHGADKVSVAIMQGGTPVSLGVYLPPPGAPGTQDAGMIVLDLR